MKFDENIAYIVSENLKHCIGLLDTQGTKAKPKVKKQLKRLLDTYFDEEDEEENNGLQPNNNVVK